MTRRELGVSRKWQSPMAANVYWPSLWFQRCQH
jgi:hypothetical protein